MLVAEDGGTFRMTLETAPDEVRVSWSVVQGNGEAELTEGDTHVAPTVEAARRWAHAAARARGFTRIRVRKSVAKAA